MVYATCSLLYWKAVISWGGFEDIHNKIYEDSLYLSSNVQIKLRFFIHILGWFKWLFTHVNIVNIFQSCEPYSEWLQVDSCVQMQQNVATDAAGLGAIDIYKLVW